MDTLKSVNLNFGDVSIKVMYLCDLPTTFGEGRIFLNSAARETLVSYVQCQGHISVSDRERLIQSPLVGFIYVDGVYWEATAVQSKETEGYLLVLYQTPESAVYYPKTQLFRFQGSNPVEDALLRSYEVRDLKELRNIIRASAAFFTNKIEPITIYPVGYDTRTKWCTYKVAVDGCCIGYTNFPLKGDSDEI